MKFCPDCERCMERDTTKGSIEYKCPSCNRTVPGDDWDARIGGGAQGAGETTAMYAKVIRTSAHDRTNQLVRKDCKNCGRDYMAQLRVGDGEIIVHTCKCGEVSSKDKKSADTSVGREHRLASVPS